MNTQLRRLAAVVVALTLIKTFVSEPSAAPASIINTSGAARVFAPPQSVGVNAWESNKYIRVLQEQSGITLQQNLSVDILGIGTFQQLSQIAPGNLAAGTTVDSYLIHQDGKKRGRLIQRGSVTFDHDIVGVILNRYRLDASDGLFGTLRTAYPTGAGLARGLEFGKGLDWVRISADRRTISFKFVTSTPMDQIRVLTAMPAIPSPGSAVLLLMAAFTAAGRRRPRKA